MMRMPTRIGLQIPNFTYPGVAPGDLFERVAAQAVAAEASGFDTVFVMDHFFQLPLLGPPELEMFEAYTLLGGLAARTQSARLGTLVTGVTYRNPALLAKQVTTLDTISGGRALLGLGAAWNDVEHEGYGFAFPPVRERMDRLDEALAIIKAMFTEDRPSFHGEHYQIEQALNVPRPVQAGGPPILIGGGGEQRTLRIAAKYADMTHWFALGLETLLHKKEVLERHCEEIGRDPGTIELTMGAPVVVTSSDAEAKAFLEAIPEERRPYVAVGSPEQVADRIRPYIEAGFTGFTFNNAIYRTPEQIALVGDLLKLVAAEEPVGAR
jgi:F420-dependent oxidoreductase-like protein